MRRRFSREWLASTNLSSLPLVGINVWDGDSDARAFLSRYGLGYPNGADLGGRIAIEYGLTGIPETFFVRVDGTMSRRWVGPLGEGQLRGFIEGIRP